MTATRCSKNTDQTFRLSLLWISDHIRPSHVSTRQWTQSRIRKQITVSAWKEGGCAKKLGHVLVLSVSPAGRWDDGGGRLWSHHPLLLCITFTDHEGVIHCPPMPVKAGTPHRVKLLARAKPRRGEEGAQLQQLGWASIPYEFFFNQSKEGILVPCILTWVNYSLLFGVKSNQCYVWKCKIMMCQQDFSVYP